MVVFCIYKIRVIGLRYGEKKNIILVLLVLIKINLSIEEYIYVI